MRALLKYCLLLCTFTKIIFAQSVYTKSVEDIIHEFINSSTVEKENSELYDLIEYYLENPINLNSASKIELMNLPFADINKINRIIKYREKNGRIFSFSELSVNKIVSDKFSELLSIFTTLNSDTNKDKKQFYKNNRAKIRSRISYNIQQSEGFITGKLTGNRIKTYNRVKYNYSEKIELGLLLEKDAGEISYYDFAPFYIKANIFNSLNILAGYFTMEFGQGLAIWSPYSFSKGSDATNSITKRERSITPYISAGEISFFKGTALQFKNSFINFSSFYSVGNNSSFINRNTYGFSLSFTRFKNHIFSVLYFLDKNGETDNIKNKSNEFISLSYKESFQNLFLAGEFSFYKQTVASINTMQITFLRNLIFVASIRNYPNDYKSIYAQGFGESNNTNNEFGFYFGVKLKTTMGVVNIYFDQFKNLSGNYAQLFPTKGNEISASYLTRITPSSTIYCRYFNEKKEVVAEIENQKQNITRQIQKLRFEFSTNISKQFSLKSRIEVLTLKSYLTTEKGFLVFQDARYKHASRILIQGRIIFFQTDSFASRIYEFENDLLGVMTNQPLWGTGLKWYLILKYNLKTNLRLSIKYSEIFKPFENSLGSGITKINGNLDNKISVQCDFNF